MDIGTATGEEKAPAYVVTGATGRTGRAVVERLLAEGRAVRALGRSRQRLEPLVRSGATAWVAEPTDEAALARAFGGAAGAYVMVQPNYVPDSPDFPAFQQRIVSALAVALRRSAVPRVVTLSSWGADKESGTGPVVGLHRLEQQVDALGVAATHARAGYFMENLLGQLDALRERGRLETPFDADVPMPFVSAEDVGHAAAGLLTEHPGPAPGSPEVVELQGERDLTLREVAAVLSELLGRPVRHEQVSLARFAADQRAAGVSASVTDLMVEVAAAVNSGHTSALQPRTRRTTTPTSIETFVAERVLPALRQTTDEERTSR